MHNRAGVNVVNAHRENTPHSSFSFRREDMNIPLVPLGPFPPNTVHTIYDMKKQRQEQHGAAGSPGVISTEFGLRVVEYAHLLLPTKMVCQTARVPTLMRCESTSLAFSPDVYVTQTRNCSGLGAMSLAAQPSWNGNDYMFGENDRQSLIWKQRHDAFSKPK